jgi:hypothetical protein
MLEERPGLSILDLAAANQNTISFITNYGHRLYSDDILLQLDETFGTGNDFVENQQNPRLLQDFLDKALQFPGQEFDGALVWDTLQFLSAPALSAVVDRLWEILRPGSCVLALFSANEQAQEVPLYSYRMIDPRTIGLNPRGTRKLAQPFNNRGLERLFQKFHSVKFFLTRDHLREVIVRR